MPNGQISFHSVAVLFHLRLKFSSRILGLINLFAFNKQIFKTHLKNSIMIYFITRQLMQKHKNFSKIFVSWN